MKQIAPIALGLALLLGLTLAQQPAATPGTPPADAAAQGGGRGGRGGPPLPFMIIRLDPGLDALIAPGTKEEIFNVPGLINAEGPLWREGKLWFSDQRGGNMFSLTMDGKTDVIYEKAGGPIDPAITVNQGPNGQAAYTDGSVLVARQGLRDIGLFKADHTWSVFLDKYEGKRFNSPNDFVISADGAVWFTDPSYSLPNARGNPPPPDSQMPITGVYRYKDGKVTRVIADMNMPNGISMSADGKILYVNSASPGPHINAYDIAADGSLTNLRVFSDFDFTPGGGGRGGVDGMKVDTKGNVWSVGPGGVNILSAQGKLLGKIQVPGSLTNVAFGGADYRDVFLTAGSTIIHVRSLVPGLKPMYARP